MERRGREHREPIGARTTCTRGSAPTRACSVRAPTAIRAGVDQHGHVAVPPGEHPFGGGGGAGDIAVPGIDPHDRARHGVGAAPVAAEVRVRDQPRAKGPLGGDRAAFGRFPVGRKAALVPGHGVALGHKHSGARLGPVAELGILPAVAVERLVESPDLVEERTAHTDVVADHRPEQVVAGCGQVAGAGHVPFRPGGIARPAREQPGQVRSHSHRRRIDAGRRHVAAEPERHRVCDRVVPAGVCRDEILGSDQVGIEEDDDVVARGPHAAVARPGEAETAARLAHDAQLQRRVRRRIEGRLGAVVNDHHLEQRARVGLPFQRRQRDGEFAPALVAGHDHRDAEARRESRARHVEGAPVVAAHPRRWWLRARRGHRPAEGAAHRRPRM